MWSQFRGHCPSYLSIHGGREAGYFLLIGSRNLGRKWAGPAFSSPLPPARLHLRKVAQPPQAAQQLGWHAQDDLGEEHLMLQAKEPGSVLSGHKAAL